MRFPLRFTSDFQLGVIARGMKTRGQSPLVLNLAPYSDSATPSLPAVETAPRIVWIGGGEPLDYPEIGPFANALAGSGREVFLQTDGRMVRRRMHEFQPSRRFRFVFRFDGATAGENSTALEAIRGAKLSGFLTCALSVVDERSNLSKLERLHRELHQLDLDGYLIVPGTDKPRISEILSAARHR